MDDAAKRRLAAEWARTEKLLSEPLRARIRDYHTEGVNALLDFHQVVGEILRSGDE